LLSLFTRAWLTPKPVMEEPEKMGGRTECCACERASTGCAAGGAR
jgi:hypothetical protein